MRSRRVAEQQFDLASFRPLALRRAHNACAAPCGCQTALGELTDTDGAALAEMDHLALDTRSLSGQYKSLRCVLNEGEITLRFQVAESNLFGSRQCLGEHCRNNRASRLARAVGVEGAQDHDGQVITTIEGPVSYTHLRAHETRHDLVCR